MLLDSLFSYKSISVMVSVKTFKLFLLSCMPKVIAHSVGQLSSNMGSACNTSSPEQCHFLSDLLHPGKNLLGKLLVL